MFNLLGSESWFYLLLALPFLPDAINIVLRSIMTILLWPLAVFASLRHQWQDVKNRKQRPISYYVEHYLNREDSFLKKFKEQLIDRYFTSSNNKK